MTYIVEIKQDDEIARLDCDSLEEAENIAFDNHPEGWEEIHYENWALEDATEEIKE